MESNVLPKLERVQTGVRMEKRLLKVLKAMAEYHDTTLGELLESIVLHAFEGQSPFSASGLKKIAQIKRVYDLDYGPTASTHPIEEPPGND